MTPKERALDALEWIQANPKHWAQNVWVQGMTYTDGSTYFRGCFATVTCLRAGLTVVDPCYALAYTLPELAPLARDGRVHVFHATQYFYRLDEPTTARLTNAMNNLDGLKAQVASIFGV